MEKLYKAFKERQTMRKRAFMVYVVIIFIEALFTWYWEYSGVRWLYSCFFMLIVLTFYCGFFYLISRPWINEAVETEIFVNLYRAIEMLEFYSKERNRFHLKRATKYVRKTIDRIERFLNRCEALRCRFFYKELIEPFKKLKELFQSRILPRVISGKNTKSMIEVLTEVAEIFGQIEKETTLDDIVSMSQKLEQLKPLEIELEPSRIKVIITRFKESNVGRVIYSLTFGYGLILVICLVYTLGTGQAFMIFARERPDIIILGGLALSGITFWRGK